MDSTVPRAGQARRKSKRPMSMYPIPPSCGGRKRTCPPHRGWWWAAKPPDGGVTALVDTGDVHCLMIGAAGVGKTANFLYPNLEYACASGMSFVTTDTKGDLYRNYGSIAKDYYGYNVSVLDLRNPTRSDGNNMLHLVNKYMDAYLADPENLSYKAKAEKYAKIISKTVINPGGADAAAYGQNAFFYDAAEGLLTSVILLIAEYCPPPKRHIISVFKLIQDLLAPSGVKGKNQFQLLIEKLPLEHKARWFAGAAINSAEQAMQSVLSTALSRLNAFLDSELEQILCFDTDIDTEKICNTKSALFLIMPEEDTTKYFLISLIVQQLYREMLAVADEHGGKLPNRVMMFLDEIGTIPKIESAEMILECLALAPSVNRSDHTILRSVGEKLRQGRFRNYRGQLPGHGLWRFRAKQRVRRDTIQGPGQQDRHERFHQPRQKRSQPVPADDPASLNDLG
jgi:type IV secretion system protein VirD4